MDDKKIKLRATITVDCDATDFMHAGQIQLDLVSIAKQLSEKYEDVTFDIRERRKSRVGKREFRSKQKVS